MLEELELKVSDLKIGDIIVMVLGSEDRELLNSRTLSKLHTWKIKEISERYTTNILYCQFHDKNNDPPKSHTLKLSKDDTYFILREIVEEIPISEKFSLIEWLKT